MNEQEMIRSLISRFPRSGEQLNGPFEADAEILRIGNQVWALTIDEFSPEEDLFVAATPAALGANLAVATLSDLLAAGASPRFYLQAVSVPRSAGPEFLDGLGQGIAGVLEQAGCFLCGGDIGLAETWRYSGVALGLVENGRPVTRIMPRTTQTLWVTGTLGDANLAAWQKRPTPAFELRRQAASVVARVGGACIDTSGGLADALWCLHQVNPGMEIRLQAARIPLAPGLREFARASGLPAEAGLVGGAGEYELLFTLPGELPAVVLDELAAAGATAIGTAAPAAAGTVRIEQIDGRQCQLAAPPPCPRAAASLDDYVRQVVAVARHLFHESEG